MPLSRPHQEMDEDMSQPSENPLRPETKLTRVRQEMTKQQTVCAVLVDLASLMPVGH